MTAAGKPVELLCFGVLVPECKFMVIADVIIKLAKELGSIQILSGTAKRARIVIVFVDHVVQVENNQKLYGVLPHHVL